MYELNGIAYAGNPKKYYTIIGVRPLDDFKLWVSFDDEETKIFDVKPLLKQAPYQPLNDVDLFNSVYIDHGAVTWDNGNIDISPDTMYIKGVKDISASNPIDISSSL